MKNKIQIRNLKEKLTDFFSKQNKILEIFPSQQMTMKQWKKLKGGKTLESN